MARGGFGQQALGRELARLPLPQLHLPAKSHLALQQATFCTAKDNPLHCNGPRLDPLCTAKGNPLHCNGHLVIITFCNECTPFALTLQCEGRSFALQRTGLCTATVKPLHCNGGVLSSAWLTGQPLRCKGLRAFGLLGEQQSMFWCCRR